MVILCFLLLWKLHAGHCKNIVWNKGLLKLILNTMIYQAAVVLPPSGSWMKQVEWYLTKTDDRPQVVSACYEAHTGSVRTQQNTSAHAMTYTDGVATAAQIESIITYHYSTKLCSRGMCPNISPGYVSEYQTIEGYKTSKSKCVWASDTWDKAS